MKIFQWSTPVHAHEVTSVDDAGISFEIRIIYSKQSKSSLHYSVRRIDLSTRLWPAVVQMLHYSMSILFNFKACCVQE